MRRKPTGRSLRRWPGWCIAVIIALAAIFVETTSSVSAAATAETRVGAFNVAGEVLVGPPEHIGAGQRLGNDPVRVVVVVATGVAANTGRTAARACSFAGPTLVLMADGSRKPIENIEVGDMVIATDPETGEQVAKRVEHVFVHDDTVIDLVVEDEVITTTEDHAFWSVTDQRFERADELGPGEKVLGADGTVITVSGLELGTAREALAYNLSVEGIHTYHVGDGEILVHNVCPSGVPGPNRVPDLDGGSLQDVGGPIWRHGDPSSLLGTRSAAELRALASQSDAVKLRDFYQAAADAGRGGSTAPIRVRLAQEIIDAWQ